MASTKNFRIAIVGGGMCGIACAVGLGRRGIRADVFEAAPQFGEVGAGVRLGLNAIKALDGLGILGPKLKKTDTERPTLRSFIFVSGYGEHEVIYDYAKNNASQFGLAIYRPAFLEALIPLLNPHRLHLNKKCTNVTPLVSGGYRLDFEDGTSHETDLVIGADGIKSTIRDCISNTDSHLVFANTVAYRQLIPHESLIKAGLKTRVDTMPICWVASNKHLITFPMRGSKMINVVMFPSDYSLPMEPLAKGPGVVNVPKSEVTDLYSDMGNDVKIIVDHFQNPSKWYIYSVNPTLSSYVSGKVVLVGDSAHGMQPHLGAGVGQGFEDVYVLCRLLGHPGTKLSNLDLVLKVYDRLRPRRANKVLEMSARAGQIYDAYGKPGCGPEWIRSRVAGQSEPVWTHDLAQEVNEALNDLEGNPAFMQTKTFL